MFTRIDATELAWLKTWLSRQHAHYVPDGYARQIVLLHPGAQVDRDAEHVPVVGHSSADGEPSPEQLGVLSRVLIGHSDAATRAHAALYDGNPDKPWPSHISEVATAIEDNVVYAVLSGTLEQLLHHDWEDERFFYAWVSMLWPADHTWFLTSDPDSVFTVIACTDNLANTLLSIPQARSTEIPDYRWDWTR